MTGYPGFGPDGKKEIWVEGMLTISEEEFLEAEGDLLQLAKNRLGGLSVTDIEEIT